MYLYAGVILSLGGGPAGGAFGIAGGIVGLYYLYSEFTSCLDTAANHLDNCTD
jgi:hypothetical protein